MMDASDKCKEGAKFNSGAFGCRDKIAAMRCLPLLLSMLLLPVPQSHAAQFPGVDVFIDEMVQRHQFERAYLESAFALARHRPSIIAAMSRPYTRKSWPEYRATVVEPRRIKRGVTFWQQHRETLARAEQQYGVPAEIVVALIGIETVYGRNLGKVPTLDALATLAFDYPRRAEFFRGELEQFLLLVREQQLDVLTVQGSYAGALGMPQFMPGSYRRYAVDFDQDGKADLLADADDAIGSVANYLYQFGWKKGEPVAVRSSDLGSEGDKTPRSLAEWSLIGITPLEPVAALDASLAATLLEFMLAEGRESWLAFGNFGAITRYNNSNYYAMSVFQLAEELKRVFHAPQ